MPVRTYRVCRAVLVCCLALFTLLGCYDAANAQVQALPQIEVTGAKQKPKPRAVSRQVQAPATVAPITPAEQLATKNSSFDQARSNLYTTVGTTSDTISHDTIEALPQGTNAPVEKVLLQAPGVSQDSAASGLLHVRNDHANVQYRINGVMLPDGVTGFGSVLDTGLIGSMSLVTGALPAEFGLRTVGLVDITTRADAFQQLRQYQYVRRQPRNHRAELRVRRHVRRQLPGVSAGRREIERSSRLTVFPACNISSPAAICRPPRASKIRCRR